MDDVASSPPQSENHPLLPRRNSFSISVVDLPHHNSSSTTTTTTTTTISSSSFPSDDLELISIKRASYSYSSLKDLLPPAAVNSPKLKAQLGPDISIRNRLVKQAAWAYLQPMSTSPGSADGNLFHRFWTRIAAFIDFVCRNVIRALDGTLRVIRIRSFR